MYVVSECFSYINKSNSVREHRMTCLVQLGFFGMYILALKIFQNKMSPDETRK